MSYAWSTSRRCSPKRSTASDRRWPRPLACQNCRSAALYRDGCFPCKEEVPLRPKRYSEARRHPGRRLGSNAPPAAPPLHRAFARRDRRRAPCGRHLPDRCRSGGTWRRWLHWRGSARRARSGDPASSQANRGSSTFSTAICLLLKPGGFEGFATRHFAQGIERLMAPSPYPARRTCRPEPE